MIVTSQTWIVGTSTGGLGSIIEKKRNMYIYCHF